MYCVTLPKVSATNQSRSPESDFEILVLEFRSYIMLSSYLMVDRGREAKISLALYRALCHSS